MRPLLVAAALGVACAPAVTAKQVKKAHVHYDMGVIAMGNGDMRAALRDLLVAVDADPGFAKAHAALGLVYHRLGRLDDSDDHYNRAVTQDSSLSEAHNNYGILLSELGRYDEAIEHFKVALADVMYDSPSLAEGNMGWTYYRKGDKKLGIKTLRNSVATSPRFCRGYLWLAKIGVEERDPDMVVANATRFERNCGSDQPDVPEVAHHEMSYYLGIGQLELGQPAQAKVAFERCASSSSGFGSKCAASLASLR